MKIDFEARRLTCSVGELVTDVTYKRIGIERGESFRRMWLGQEIHSRRADHQAGADPMYRPEVTVSHSRERYGWTVEISGRIDGLSIDQELRTLRVEEVKSLHFDLELAALQRSDRLQRWMFQLLLYALFLSLDERYDGWSIDPRLVLIDLVTENPREIPVDFAPEDVERALDSALGRIVEELESTRALQLAKQAWAEELAFPYDAMRLYQREMVEAVAHAARERETLLVSAPTGVGKTMAAIYPALVEALRTGRKLFFLTSKTLQQDAAVEALRLLNDGTFRVLRVRAKRKMCAHTEVVCHEDFCPFASAYTEKVNRSGIVDRIATENSYLDPDLIFEAARTEQVCPFEVSLELLEQADVIVCDYNYVFDPYVGLRTWSGDNDWSDTILIVDEAHNLVDRARGYYSPDIEQSTVQQVRWHFLSRAGFNAEDAEDLLRELEQEMTSLGAIASSQPEKRTLTEFDARFFLRQRASWERIVLNYIGWKIENRIADEEDPIIDFYFRLVKFANRLTHDGDEFAHVVEAADDGVRLRIICLDASRFTGEVFESAHASIVMSATLTPFDFYRTTLGLPQSRSAEIDLPSPFPRENRRILVYPGVETTWKARAANYDGIAENVAATAREIRGNVLALFPSYSFLEHVSTRLPSSGKEVMVQRTDMTDWERRNLLDRLRDGHDTGHLILAVSGGMYAEGVDYQGDMLNGVIVVGPSLPGVSFEQELLKQYYDNLYGSGFEYAYLIPGMTRVIQSAGRVIRSETDIGVIALFCKRFTFQTYNRYFPPHWFEQSPRELVSRNPAETVRAFFEQQVRLPVARKSRRIAAASSGQMNLLMPLATSESSD